MRKIRYKKGRRVQSQTYEYTGIYTDKKTEMQLFVYNEQEVDEFERISVDEFFEKKSEWRKRFVTSSDFIEALAKINCIEK